MMKKDTVSGSVRHVDGVKMEELDISEGIFIQWLVADEQGSKRVHLRRFVMEPKAHMPSHTHSNCEHVQYYLKGDVRVEIGDETYDVGPGDSVFIPEDTPHSYTNIGDEKAVFLCIVPGVEIDTEIHG